VNDDIAQEILHELFSSLEALETQSTAILQLLKDKGLATEQELALHLEQAGNASNVRWRAAQVRIDHLVSSAIETAERNAKQESSRAKENSQQSSTKTDGQTSHASEGQKEGRKAQQVAPSRRSEGNKVDTTAQKNQGQQATENENDGPGENARKNAA
jgi:hypothetical protein